MQQGRRTTCELNGIRTKRLQTSKDTASPSTRPGPSSVTNSREPIRDPDHSEREERFTTIGMTLLGRVVIVWHADWVDDEGESVVRLIGARRATPNERRAYELEE